MADNKKDQIRKAAEADLLTFIHLVAPHRVLGQCHEDVIQWWNRKDHKPHQLVLFPRDHQKALRLDQKVLTPSGWKEIGQLQVGDDLYGVDGDVQQITHLHPKSIMSLYEVEFTDGRKVVCNEEHLWTLRCPSNTGNKLVTKPLKEIALNYKSKKFDKRNNKEYTEWRYFAEPPKPIQFVGQSLEIDPYVLGCWLGDGTSRSANITSADPELFTYFPYNVHKLKSKYAYGVEGLHTKLRKLGLLQNKHIPEPYLRGSISQREALLQGLLDTDGHAHCINKNLSFTTIKKDLRDSVLALVRSLGGRATWCDAYTKSSKESTKLFHSYWINIWLPNDIIPFKLTRKQIRVQKNMRLCTALKNITPVEKQEARCITVSNSDGLFITEDYLVTHNSAMLGYRVAWTITKEPDTTFLYISATTTLAEKQVKFIQDILLSTIYRRYWPDMVHEQEALREKWTAREFSVDHPKRKQEFVRDPTVFAAGLDTNVTGLHFRRAVLDDIVVRENAYTDEGRNKVAFAYSLLASVESTDSEEWVAGTRYHPADLYNDMITMEYAVHDEHGHETGSEPVYEVYEKVLEDSVDRDGTGQYLWPKQRRYDGKHFGFDIKEYSKKKAKYIDKGQFYAQYYNDPSDPTNMRLSRDRFQYYDPMHLRLHDGNWYFKDRRLNILASLDLAFSESKRADYTAIVVAGIDEDNNIYVLYIDRFKTSKASVIFEHLLDAHNKWYFRRLRAETVSGQEMIVGELKNYMKEYGVYFSIDDNNPTRHDGSKQERIAMTLMPRYDTMSIWHFRGGNCQVLEDELVYEHPEHDDIADAFAAVVQVLRAPSRNLRRQHLENKPAFNQRFGGVSF